MNGFNGPRVRGYLLASSAMLALPGVAHAQASSSRPEAAIEVAHSGPNLTSLVSSARPDEAVEAPHTSDLRSTTGFGELDGPTETPQITINNNFTPVQAYDPANVNGVGQIISDSGGGFIGLCTGTLINRRTVIFAAHCVNSRAATAYGANSGGVGIGVGFETNTRANAAGQPDELVNWLLGGSTGPGQFKSNTAQHFYNMNQVYWNPQSVSASSCTSATSCFLEADVALGVLDTPANAVPTWAMLFSPLNTPSAINPATGTGYHVTVTGYGSFGNGTTGSASNSNYRRRVAENMLGALTSFNDRNTFLFGSAGSPSRPQVLYFLDFDDPARGTAAANPRDFNSFRDNALPREGTTGPGDSGGPLILDQAYSKKLVIGVLSGGSTFFTGQPGGSYGTQSFYQPLFLYWDWIVANNPYRYVSAKAGNKNWEDGTAWQTDLDPNYNILIGNTLTNGVPTNLGGGPTGSSPKFGEYCYQAPLNSSAPPIDNECQDATTGAPRNNVPNNPSGSDSALPGVASIEGGDVALPGTGQIDGAIETAQAAPGYSDTVNPAATLANGLPGATNFVPNNVDPVRATGGAARYFDVTLREAGAITLNSTATIDNMTIRGASSRLNVASAGSLTSLFEFQQLTGVVQNDGAIRSVGDYFLMSGLLTGSGRVTAPYLTSVLGSIAPGTMGTIGTLTYAASVAPTNGTNLTLSSGSNLLIDLGPNGTSDRLAVVAGPTGSGSANVGGNVIFTPAAGTTVRFGDVYTILTAAGGVNGTFNQSASLSAILTPQFIYSANMVQARITAGQYRNVVQNSPVQIAYAGLLDQNRATNYANLSGLYGVLDLQNTATIQSTLESWAPRTEALARSLSTAAVESVNRLYRGRVASMDLSGGLDGSLAVIGNPLQLASNAAANVQMPGSAVTASDSGDAMITPGRFAEGTRAFLAGGYIDGEGRSMLTAVPFGGKDKFDGWYAAAGIETQLGENAAIGFGLSYSNLDGTTGGVAQSVDGELFQGTLYGKTATTTGLTLDAIFSGGLLAIDTRRAAALGGTVYDLRSKDNTLAVSTEVGLGMMFGQDIKFGPRVAMRASNIGFSKTVERGGPMALRLSRGDQGSAQGLAGVSLSGATMSFKPYASVYFVHEFLDRPLSTGANFVSGVGANSLFALNGTDRNWGEASVGLTFGGERVSFSVAADTTFLRKDVSNQAYRGSVSIKF